MLNQLNIPKSKLFKAVGIILCTLPTLVVAILLIVFSSMKRDYDDYDRDLILVNEIRSQGEVTDIEVRTNIEIENQNPYIFKYTYWNGADHVKDSGEVLGSHEVQKIQIGDHIPVGFWNNESIILEHERSTVPLGLFYVIPAVFIPIGFMFLFLSRRVAKT
jgi:hypothetical protein